MGQFSDDFKQLARVHLNQIMRMRKNVPIEALGKLEALAFLPKEGIVLRETSPPHAHSLHLSLGARTTTGVSLHWGVKLSVVQQLVRRTSESDCRGAHCAGRARALPSLGFARPPARTSGLVHRTAKRVWSFLAWGSAGGGDATESLLDLEGTALPQGDDRCTPTTTALFEDESEAGMPRGPALLGPTGQRQSQFAASDSIVCETESFDLEMMLSGLSSSGLGAAEGPTPFTWRRLLSTSTSALAGHPPVTPEPVIPLIVALSSSPASSGRAEGRLHLSLVSFSHGAGGGWSLTVARQFWLCHEFGAVEGLGAFTDGDEGPGAECVICCSRRKNVVFLPCRHCSICVGCLKALRQDRCPMCRTAYEGHLVMPFVASQGPQRQTSDTDSLEMGERTEG
eukprot:Polyplicarium_translucidae@DN2361_c0_g1_i10.p1